MEFRTEILSHNTRVFVGEGHSFGTDALLLARFCTPRPMARAADLCSGCGIVALQWHDDGHRGPCAAVEIMPKASALCEKAVQENPQAGHITPVLADLRGWRSAEEGLFDVVACNPPYFNGGFVSKDASRAAARHQQLCTAEDAAACAFRLLRDGGRFAMVQKPENLSAVLCALSAARLEPKRLALVKNRPGDAPVLFLVEAQKNRKPGLTFAPEILLERGAARY